jgi:hypothetical protein
MRCFLSASILVIAIAWCSIPTCAGEMYKWTDKDGNLHLVTSLADVPEKYRTEVLAMAPSLTPATKLPAQSKLTDPLEPSLIATDDAELRRFEVPYENEGSAKRVIIPVQINESVTASMAVDTGSPGMIISADLATRVGVFSGDSGILITAAAGIGGETPAILTIIDSVSVEGARAEFVPTTVVDELSENFDGLIGMDFVANYTMSIDSRKQVVVFQEVHPDPESRGGHDERWWRDTFGEFRFSHDSWRDHAEAVSRKDWGARPRPFLDHQVREAQKLLQKLEMYASHSAVPRHWREKCESCPAR